MTLRWIARDLIEKRGYRGLSELACPILIRECRRHSRWEWYDPINRTGGIARDLKSLQEQLRHLYYCRCGLYHVDWVAIVVSEDFQSRTYQLKEISFVDFLKGVRA